MRMYAVFTNEDALKFVVVGFYYESDLHIPPDSDYYKRLGTLSGYLDTMSFVNTQASMNGWRTYTVEFVNVHRG